MLCVRLSVRRKPVYFRNGWTRRSGLRDGSCPQLIPHCVMREFGISLKHWKSSSPWNLVPNSERNPLLCVFAIARLPSQILSSEFDRRKFVTCTERLPLFTTHCTWHSDSWASCSVSRYPSSSAITRTQALCNSVTQWQYELTLKVSDSLCSKGIVI